MIDFLLKILAIDSTSGKEEELTDYLIKNLRLNNSVLEIQEIPNGKKNLFFKCGKPKIIFCSHIDTVPNFIPPHKDGEIIYGRGSCDAKGQVAVMYEACKQLIDEQCSDFGLLLVVGEEVGTYGAKQANESIKGSEYVIICEPTCNKLIQASKGVLLIDANFKGKPFHSAYPECGDDAIDRMRVFLNKLVCIKFPKDAMLGDTTYNIGLLSSQNAINIVSDDVKCKIYFRTTFASHLMIEDAIRGIADKNTVLHFLNNEHPIKFHTLGGFETGVVSFGTDAPKLCNLGKRLLYGAGNILVAHTENEHIEISSMKKAVCDLKNMYYKVMEKI